LRGRKLVSFLVKEDVKEILPESVNEMGKKKAPEDSHEESCNRAALNA
jgi:hypothetical protein